MKFKIRCESIKEFDAEKGAYVKCNSEVSVDSTQVGTLVRCPNCGNDVEVIDPSLVSSAQAATGGSPAESADDDWIDEKPSMAKSGGESISSVPQSTTSQTHADQAHAKTARPDPSPDNATADQGTAATEDDADGVIDFVTDTGPLESTKTPPKPAVSKPVVSKQTETPTVMSPSFAAPTQTNPAGELKKESFDQAAAPMLRATTFDRSNCCRKCGTLLEEKQPVCPNCQTRRQARYVDKKDRKPFSRKGPFGFQLWLDSITKGPTDPNSINWLAIIAYTFAILLMGSGLFLIIFGGVSGIFVGPFMIFAGFALFTAVRYWGKARENPRTPVPVLGQVTWVVMLFLIRNLRFSRVKPEKRFDKKGDASFGDEELAAMKNLGKFRVIDLEGTSVTDEGIVSLFDLRGIEYLVLRNTEVTADGAHDLQQTIPKTWIWS